MASRFHGGIYRLAIHQKRDDEVGPAFFADQLVGVAENDVPACGLGSCEPCCVYHFASIGEINVSTLNLRDFSTKTSDPPSQEEIPHGRCFR
ncbi:hypothetical protein [Ralstonia chuxiongensis]|uniref:hypothetical protein n=1 Tax=Ralstonia chuxiongensis TaxID=2957504 RepID=UPI002931B8E2|nr:hypothetical protein [Ralstonia chuxiongensis]